MKLLSYLTELKSDKALKSDHPEAKPDSKKKPPAARQRVSPLWPLAQIQETDWLKLYKAMDTAG